MSTFVKSWRPAHPVRHSQQASSEAQQPADANPHAAAASAVLARAASMKDTQQTPQQSAAALFGAPPVGGGMYISRLSDPSEDEGSPASVAPIAVSQC